MERNRLAAYVPRRVLRGFVGANAKFSSNSNTGPVRGRDPRGSEVDSLTGTMPLNRKPTGSGTATGHV